ncbi:MAG TPA: sugar ABC transporter ATP-binding protein [Pirellulales bacterium]|jgi:ribose transport system ATP-binding protein|nr:sugar ABC transporter ATP-binding protein [Pirellulales bacterium]
MGGDSFLLEMHGIAKRFGATHALRDVSLAARAGEVVALIGENGAGKSTLMKVLSGAHRPDAGTMHLDGKPYHPTGPHEARAAGVAMIYQELNLAPDLSVEDNIMLGQELHTVGLVRQRAQRERVARALALLGHPELRPQARTGDLSVGAQQLVEIARALVFEARVIVFDEPTSSLGHRDVQHLFAVVEKLKRSGRAIIYISHFLEEIRTVADAYAVLRDGQTVGHGCLADATDAQIVTLMVGRSIDDLFPSVAHAPGEPVLALEGLSGRKMPHNVTLTLRRGEVLGLAGLVGSGRSELLRSIFGLESVRSGEVRVAGARFTPRPRAAIRAGLGMLSEDRKGEGLAQDRSIEDNISLSYLRPYTRWGWLNRRWRARSMAGLMRSMEIKARSPEQPVRELSGGNQQKVAIARLVHQNADVLLLDEPTRSIDVGTKAMIYRMLGQWAAEGKAIVFVSSYLPELLAMCDRIAVMHRGRLRDVRPRDQWTDETVMACAVGAESE